MNGIKLHIIKVIPVENKIDSWGWLDNHIVAVDYGSDYRSGYSN